MPIKLLVDNGFSNKPVLKGTGAMAGEAYAWAVANPGKVSCIYARNPLMKSLMAGKEQPIDNLAALAKAGVPVLHDCGALDPWLDSQTRVVEKRYKELAGKITVIVREGEGHFPLSPKDPKSVVDFIVRVGLESAPSDKAAPHERPAPARSGVERGHQVRPPQACRTGGHGRAGPNPASGIRQTHLRQEQPVLFRWHHFAPNAGTLSGSCNHHGLFPGSRPAGGLPVSVSG